MNHVTHSLSSSDISIFSPEVSNFCYIKKKTRLQFDGCSVVACGQQCCCVAGFAENRWVAGESEGGRGGEGVVGTVSPLQWDPGAKP